MQSLILQIGVRAGTFLSRWRPPLHIARADGSAGEVARVASVQAANAGDQQISLVNILLQSVCQKLLLRIRELDCVSGELNNLMKVCAIPAIFVDDKLIVRRFTRESRRIYRLSHQDIGRSLLDVACGLDYYSLGEDFRKAAETGKAVNRCLEQRGCEVRYFLRILPNFCRDNSFGGAALIFSPVEAQYWGTA
jgi:two-component system CheB/CheR fusion protein